jgi:hypothetical protein
MKRWLLEPAPRQPDIALEQLSDTRVMYFLELGQFVDLHIKGSPEALVAVRER